MNVRYSYLKEKFANPDPIWERIKQNVVLPGDFTIGKEVLEFEKRFAETMGVKYAIGVANGTDALVLSLWLAGVRAGDEVIAPANTFVASLGAIGLLQAKPILVDMDEHYVMDVSQVEKSISNKTKAILPVHFCGNPVDMTKLMEVANHYGLPVIEDACQAYLAEWGGKCVGTFGLSGAFSLHPLKILNVWGDGGVITTNDDNFYHEAKLLQNHGMQTRDNITRWPCYNSRLDSIHAAVGNAQIDKTPDQVATRRRNADFYTRELNQIPGVKVVIEQPEAKSCRHLFFFEVDASIRPQLYAFLHKRGIDAKIHYELPLYLQPGLSVLGYGVGDFPVADSQASRYITLPCDEHLTDKMLIHCVDTVSEFMLSL